MTERCPRCDRLERDVADLVAELSRVNAARLSRLIAAESARDAAVAEAGRLREALIAVRAITLGGCGHGRSGALDALEQIRAACNTALEKP